MLLVPGSCLSIVSEVTCPLMVLRLRHFTLIFPQRFPCTHQVFLSDASKIDTLASCRLCIIAEKLRSYLDRVVVNERLSLNRFRLVLRRVVCNNSFGNVLFLLLLDVLLLLN